MRRIITIVLLMCLLMNNTKNIGMAAFENNITFKVIRSTETIEGQSLEFAIDSDSLSYTEFSSFPVSFTLGFGQEVSITSLRFVWGKDSYATDYVIEDVDYYGNVITKITDVTNANSNDQLVEMDHPVISSYIKITVSKKNNENNLVLNRIEVRASLTHEVEMIKSLISKSNHEVILSETDPTNPLSIFRVPIEQDIQLIAKYILHNDTDLSPHQKVMKFINYMSDYKIGFASNATPMETILERIAQCGSFTNTLLALAKAEGIDGRIIYLMNYPEGYGHTVAELWINDKWQLYDPTYGVYYTDTPNDQINPNVLSFEELKRGEGRRKGVSRIVGIQERVNEGGTVALEFISPTIYERAFPSGVIGPSNPFYFPLLMDYKERKSINREEYGTKYQGASYIGAAYVNTMQTWTLASLQPGATYKFILYPDFHRTEGKSNFVSFVSNFSGGEVLSGLRFNYSDKANNPWIIFFKATDTQVKFQIEHPYFGPDFNYLMIKKYTLLEVR